MKPKKILGDGVLILPIAEQSSSFFDTGKKVEIRGTIVMVGTQTKEPIKVGDEVMFNSRGQIEMNVDGERHLLMSEQNLKAIL